MNVLQFKKILTFLLLLFSIGLFAQPEKVEGILFLCGKDQPIVGEFQVYKKSGLIMQDKKFYQKKKYSQFIADDESIILEGGCIVENQKKETSNIVDEEQDIKLEEVVVAENEQSFNSSLVTIPKGDLLLNFKTVPEAMAVVGRFLSQKDFHQHEYNEATGGAYYELVNKLHTAAYTIRFNFFTQKDQIVMNYRGKAKLGMKKKGEKILKELLQYLEKYK